MEPLLQRIEVESIRRRDHYLPVDHCARRHIGDERVAQFGEVAIERLQLAALNVEVGLAPEHDRAKAVPLGLIEEAAVGKRCGELRQHRLDRRLDREPLWHEYGCIKGDVRISTNQCRAWNGPVTSERSMVCERRPGDAR